MTHELLHVIAYLVYFVNEYAKNDSSALPGLLIFLSSIVNLLDKLVDDLVRVLIRDYVGILGHELDSLLQKLLTSTEQEVGGAGLALGGNILHVRKDLPLLVRDRYLRVSAVN